MGVVSAFGFIGFEHLSYALMEGMALVSLAVEASGLLSSSDFFYYGWIGCLLPLNSCNLVLLSHPITLNCSCISISSV